MSDAVQQDLTCCCLRFLDGVLPRVPFRRMFNSGAPAIQRPSTSRFSSIVSFISLRSEIVRDRELDIADFTLYLDNHFRFAVGGGEEWLAVFSFIREDEPEDLVGKVSRRHRR